jgi:hypothetical protein
VVAGRLKGGRQFERAFRNVRQNTGREIEQIGGRLHRQRCVFHGVVPIMLLLLLLAAAAARPPANYVLALLRSSSSSAPATAILFFNQ